MLGSNIGRSMIHGKINKAFLEELVLEIREDEPLESQGKGAAEKAGRSAQAWGEGRTGLQPPSAGIAPGRSEGGPFSKQHG